MKCIGKRFKIGNKRAGRKRVAGEQNQQHDQTTKKHPSLKEKS